MERIRELLKVLSEAQSREKSREGLRSQVVRLEAALARLDRPLPGMDDEARLGREDRRMALRAKIRWLQDELDAVQVAPLADQRAWLVELIRLLREEGAAESEGDAVRLHERVVAMVRARRGALSEVVQQLEQARDAVRAVGEMLTAGPAARMDTRLREERALAWRRARQRRDGALGRLQDLAVQWPELQNLAGLEDWNQLPFEALSSRVAAVAADADTELPGMVTAVAGWLEELARRVDAAPPP
jgi:hypothetical protein